MHSADTPPLPPPTTPTPSSSFKRKRLADYLYRHKPGEPLIAIGLSFYQDANCLAHCLSSIFDNSGLQDYVKVLAIDGAYKGFPSNHPLSEDGSREVIRSFKEKHPNAIELYDYPRLHERFKRQKYVDIAASQNIPWLLILDSDEYIECKKPRRFLEEVVYMENEWLYSNILRPEITPRVGNVFQVKSIDLDNNGYPSQVMMRPRLWYRPEDMHYTTKHYWFARKEDIMNNKLTPTDVLNSQYKPLQIEHLVIWHDHSCRPEEREAKREIYEQDRLPKLEE